MWFTFRRDHLHHRSDDCDITLYDMTLHFFSTEGQETKYINFLYLVFCKTTDFSFFNIENLNKLYGTYLVIFYYTLFQ